MGETSYRYRRGHCLPAELFDKRRDDGLKRDAVERGGVCFCRHPAMLPCAPTMIDRTPEKLP